YLAGVRAKAFLITVLLMPVMLALSIGLQLLFAKMEEGKAKTYVMIDRTPGQEFAVEFQKIGKQQREFLAKDPKSKGLFGENVAFQVVSPSEPTAEAMGRQRFEFSRKVESGEIEALIEVGPLVLEGRASSAAGSSDVKDDTAVIRYQTRSA